MRMWMISPRFLCRQHLLGEHYELHKLAGSLRRGKRLGRLLTHGLVDPSQMYARHEQVAAEMERRGYRHRSPMTQTDSTRGRIDIERNARDLQERCPACAERMGR